MNAHPPVILVVDHAVWWLARLKSGELETTTPVRWEGESIGEEAERITASLKEWQSVGTPILIGLGATLCVSTLIKLPTSRHAHQRQAMGYLLEPFLPWSAEEMVADFEVIGREAFAVGTCTEILEALLKQLAYLGVQVESVFPLARLALQQSMLHTSFASERWACLWGEGSLVDLWIIEKKTPLIWRQVPLEEVALLRELRQIALHESNPLPLALRGVPVEMRARIESLPDFVVSESVHEVPATIIEAALHAAPNIVAGRWEAPIEFLRDALAPESRNRLLQGPMRAVQVAVLCLLIASCFTLYRIGESFDRDRLVAGDQQEDIFRMLFPDTPVPVGIAGRLESEYVKLRDLRGDDIDIPKHVSSIVLIEKLLRSLPPDLRYRILEIRVEQGGLYLVGHVREHADADRIADELRKISMIVDPPSTHRLPQQGVEFRISARLISEKVTDQEGKS